MSNGIDETIQLFVPLVARQFTLYKFLNTPIFIQGNSSDTARLATVKTQHALIAVDDAGTTLNVPMTKDDLEACLTLGQHHLCSDLVKHNRYQSSCIGTLFGRTPDAILEQCAFTWDPQPWRIDKRSNSSHLLSTTIPLDIQKQCAPRRTIQEDQPNATTSRPNQDRPHSTWPLDAP